MENNIMSSSYRCWSVRMGTLVTILSFTFIGISPGWANRQETLNTNLANNINAIRTLNNSSSELATSLEKLSSGLRINSASDDAAGLAISTRLQADIDALRRAAANADAGDGLSLYKDYKFIEAQNNPKAWKNLIRLFVPPEDQEEFEFSITTIYNNTLQAIQYLDMSIDAECTFTDRGGVDHETCCDNDSDDDEDGLIDCRDDDCFNDPACV